MHYMLSLICLQYHSVFRTLQGVEYQSHTASWYVYTIYDPHLLFLSMLHRHRIVLQCQQHQDTKRFFPLSREERVDKLPSFLSLSADIVCSWPEQKKKIIVVLQLQIGNVVQENVTYSLWNYIRYANVRLLNNGNGLDVIFYCSVGERSWAPALLNNWN